MLAVDIQSDPPVFDEENRIVDPDEVVKMCGSLVRLNTNAQGLNEITAAHTSVIDFLTTRPIKIGEEEVVGFSKTKSNLRMAETCLVYLRHLSDNCITMTGENVEKYPFARLSAIIWDACYREVLITSGREDMIRLNSLVMNLFSSPTATLNWIKLSGRYEADWADFMTGASHIKRSIYLAAYFGLSDIVQSMIQEGYPVDGVSGSHFGTPLVAACAMGRTNAVSLLLDSGAEPKLSSHFQYGTPMVAAIVNDQIEIVHLLLGAKTIDLNERRHPLIDATKEILEQIAEYDFLTAKCRRNEAGHVHREWKGRLIEIGTRLVEIAKSAQTEDWESERLRIVYDSDDVMDSPNLRNSTCSTGSIDPKDRRKSGDAISNDLEELHHERLLHRATAASERIKRSGESMVYTAVKRSTVEILKALLAAGSDPNTLGGTFGTPLQKACVYSNEEAVRILLENGARHDVYGGYYGSSLNAACNSDELQIIELLINAGADVNRSEDSQFGKSLSMACVEEGRFEIVNMLVKAGADVHRTDIVGKSALLTAIASRESRLDSFDYLIGLGANPLQKDKRGCNGLHYAARAKKCDIIKRLLEYAINVNEIDLNGWSPLHWAVASMEDSTEILSLLLQRGCDTNIRDKQGRTALNLAILFNRSEEIVILGGSTQINMKFFVDEGTSEEEWICDGCEIVSML